MKDIFNSYHKNKVLTNFGLLTTAFIFALSINMFVLNGENTGKFKANIREANTSQINASDFSGRVDGDEIIFSVGESIMDLTELSFSLTYNHEIVDLSEFESNDSVSVVSMNNSPGFSTYIISFSNPQEVQSGTDILRVPYIKSEGKTVHMNPVNVNFTDSLGNTYSLSSSSFMF